MADFIRADTGCYEDVAKRLNALAASLSAQQSLLRGVQIDRSSGADVSVQLSGSLRSVGARMRSGDVQSCINSLADCLSKLDSRTDRLARNVKRAGESFADTERQIIARFDGLKSGTQESHAHSGIDAGVAQASGVVRLSPAAPLTGAFAQKFMDELSKNYGVSDLLAGSNYIKKLYGFYQALKNGASWEDYVKTGVDIFQFASGVKKTFGNYMKIGNAIGKKKALSYFVKQAVGWKPLGRASTAQNLFQRFKGNLFNKTSPFNLKAKFSEVVGDFAGKGGAGKAVASWAGVAVDGVTNWFSNKEEQANSNGTMSDARVVAETITETVVGTVAAYGAGVVVGAAVTTALGTVAAPAVLVTAASGLVIAGVDAGVKALTGKNATEWVSDAILDTGAAIGKGIKSAAKSIGSWFSKL